jgi:hypothetical protein
MELSEKAKGVVRSGSIKIRVLRNGMLQQLTFRIKHVTHGNISYIELYTDRIVDISELIKASNLIGLPIESPNCKAFPTGTSAVDFQIENKA